MTAIAYSVMLLVVAFCVMYGMCFFYIASCSTKAVWFFLL